MDRMPSTASEVQFHLDRLDAWFRDLWEVKDMDLHMCDGTVKEGQRGTLLNIRDDVRVLRAELAKHRKA